MEDRMSRGTVTLDGVVYTGSVAQMSALLALVYEVKRNDDHVNIVTSTTLPIGPGAFKRFLSIGPDTKVLAEFEYDPSDLSDEATKRLHDAPENVQILLEQYLGNAKDA
jgi:hypothetical protein